MKKKNAEKSFENSVKEPAVCAASRKQTRPHRTQRLQKVVGILVLATFSVGSKCSGPVKETIDNAFVQYLSNTAGYTALPMPSSLESGGSLVYVTGEGDNKKIEWVGDLLSCDVPESVVFGESEETRNRLRNASFPVITASSKNDFGIGITAAIKGIGVNADLGIIRKTVVTVDEAGHEVVQRLEVANYLADPLLRRKMKAHCSDALVSQKVAVLVDVAYVEKGKFEFFKDDGLTVKANRAEVEDALDLDANARAKVTADGAMTINERIFVAVKAAFYVPTSGTLAGSDTDLEDAIADLKAALNGE